MSNLIFNIFKPKALNKKGFNDIMDIKDIPYRKLWIELGRVYPWGLTLEKLIKDIIHAIR